MSYAYVTRPVCSLANVNFKNTSSTSLSEKNKQKD